MHFVAFFFCGFASAIANRTTDPLTVEIATDLGVPVSSVALLASVLAFMYAAGQPVIGPAGDHFGKARILKIAMWVAGLSVLASAFAPNFQVLMALRPITGLASGGIVPIGMAMIGDLYPAKGRQVALARFIMSAIIGQMAGALLAGSLAAWIGWRGVMLVCAAIVLTAALATTLLLPSTPARKDSHFNIATMRANYAKVLASPRARVCFSSPFIIGGLTFGLLPFIAAILESQGNGGAREAGFIIAGFGGGALLLAAGLPFVLRYVKRPAMIVIGSIVAAASLAAYALGLHWSVQIVLLTVFGFGFFMQHNSIQAEVSELAPDARATAYSMHSSAMFLGQALGPAIYGVEIATLGAPATLMANALVILVAGILIGRYFLHQHRRFGSGGIS